MASNQKPAGARASMRTKNKIDPRLGKDIQSRIGQQLRTMYDEVVKQGVPERFVHLLNRLDKDDSKQ
jgi:hypothetical protein